MRSAKRGRGGSYRLAIRGRQGRGDAPPSKTFGLLMLTPFAPQSLTASRAPFLSEHRTSHLTVLELRSYRNIAPRTYRCSSSLRSHSPSAPQRRPSVFSCSLSLTQQNPSGFSNSCPAGSRSPNGDIPTESVVRYATGREAGASAGTDPPHPRFAGTPILNPTPSNAATSRSPEKTSTANTDVLSVSETLRATASSVSPAGTEK